MDEDDVEDIEEDIKNARAAWEKVFGKDTMDYKMKAISGAQEIQDGEADDEKLEQLLEAIGTTYSAEDHGKALRNVGKKCPKGSDVLEKGAFVDWYIRYVYANEGSEDE